METEEQIKSMNDHDLLIVIHTTVKHLIENMKELKDNTVDRVTSLELEKMSRDEAERRHKESDGIHRDHELRLRRLETWGAMAAGGLFVIELLLKYYIK